VASVPDGGTVITPVDRQTRLVDAAFAAVMALDDFDNETILSLVRPGRLSEWKAKMFELRVELEEAADAV
jgi:hypothetical protein